VAAVPGRPVGPRHAVAHRPHRRHRDLSPA
jgi:hypothetical protein